MDVSTSDAFVASVIVPCLQHAPELRRCLASLASQRCAGAFEVIVVDAGADEAVAAIANSFASVRLVRGEAVLMPGEARNLGADRARGACFFFIDADCTAEPGWLDAALEALRAGAKMVGGSVLDGDPRDRIAFADNLLQFADFAEGRPRGPARLLPSCNLALRRSDFEASGGFPRTGFPAGEDTLFSARASERWGDGVRFVPSMRVRHFGRTALDRYREHQELFGYVRALYALELRPIHLQLGRSALFAPAVGAKRLVYVAYRTLRWNPRALLRLTIRLPVLLYGLAAWSGGFRRGCRVRALARSGDAVPSGRQAIALDGDCVRRRSG